MMRTLFAIVSVLAVGCSVQSPSSENDDEHELHHEVPAHRPRNVAVAAQSLERYRKQFSAGKLDAVARKQVAGELLDVVRWLPEIAADSDMPEPDWTQLYTDSQSVEPSLRQFAEGGGDDFGEIDKPLETLIGHLSVIVAKGEWKANEPFEATHEADDAAGHNHHDHHHD